MSNPSFSNIDVWLFELREGNLSPEQVAKLEAFLLMHPEFDVDKDMWGLAQVEATEVIYPHQKRLERRKAPVIYWWTSAAATLIVGGLFLMFNSSEAARSLSSENRQSSISTRVTNSENSNVQNELKLSNFIEKKYLIKSTQSKVKNNAFGHFESTSILLVNPAQHATNEHQIQQHVNNFSPTIPSFKSNEEERLIAQNFFDLGQFKLKKLSIASKDREGIQSYKKEIAFEDWKLHRTKASNSSQSFSYKMRSMKRAIQKMADNPIALKNLKDPHYHIPGMQAVDVNFGAVGTLLATRVQTTSRYQWLGNLNEQLSNQLLVDGYVYAIRGGIGLQVNQSNYHNNAYQSTFAAITYSPKFSVSKNVTVEPAIRFKMGNKSINPSKISVGELVEFDRSNAQQFYSENETPTGNTLWFKDVGASVMVNTKWFFTGIQFDNLAQHHSNIYGSKGTQRTPIHSVLTIGTDYQSANKKMSFSPYLVYQKYGHLSEAWIGTNFRVNWLTIGAAISSNLEPSASLGVKFKHIALTYNADYTHSMLLSKSALSHQLTIRFITKPSRIGQRLLNF